MGKIASCSLILVLTYARGSTPYFRLIARSLTFNHFQHCCYIVFLGHVAIDICTSRDSSANGMSSVIYGTG